MSSSLQRFLPLLAVFAVLCGDLVRVGHHHYPVVSQENQQAASADESGEHIGHGHSHSHCHHHSRSDAAASETNQCCPHGHHVPGDPRDHHDCPTCIALSVASAATLSACVSEFSQPLVLETVAESEAIFVASRQNVQRQRGPPA